jgi:hypothetical protein
MLILHIKVDDEALTYKHRSTWFEGPEIIINTFDTKIV